MNGRHHAKGVSGGGWPRAAWAAILVLLCGGEQLLLCIEATTLGKLTDAEFMQVRGTERPAGVDEYGLGRRN